MRLLFAVATFVAITITSSAAYAFCFAPSFSETEPSAPGTFSKPSPPYCMTSNEGCEQWEIDSYIGNINEYINDLSNYASEATDFANEAIAYANEAHTYAECEVRDAKTQHQ